MEKNVVTVKTVTPAVLEELEELRSRIAKCTVELFTDRGRGSGMNLDPRLRAQRGIVSRPQIVIADMNEYMEVRVALPGFHSEEITVFVEPRTITISGKRRGETYAESKNFDYSGINPGEVFRRFQLPAEARPDGARAALRDGILSLSLPKASTSKKEVNADGPSAA